LHVRWLGSVPYREALAVQEALFEHGSAQHLLLLEHPHVVTYGPRADLARNVLVDLTAVGADFVAVNRGGDVTYHGPGQLVGYPIVSLQPKHGSGTSGLADSVAYVHSVEQLIIDSLGELGVTNAGRLRDYPGVWIDPDGPDPRKICAIGVRLTRGRTMHGFALNVAPDLRAMREWIVPCGIADKAVTSLAEEGVDVPMREVADVVARLAADLWGGGQLERQDVAWRHRPDDLSAFSRGEGPGTAVRTAADHGVPEVPEISAARSGVPVRLLGRLADAGVTDGHAIAERKPEWLRPKVVHGPEVLSLKRTLRDLDLVTVCEEAGCPNLSECWSDGTATFMVLGERCTRACGFCLVDTRKPLEVDLGEPSRVAEAVERLDLAHAVLTMVARDDLPDGGMGLVAATVEAIRLRRPATTVETLISDAKGEASSLEVLFAARPDVLNHNVETVPRLQRAVRPSAGYARSLGVLSRAKAAGLTTKSGLIVGMGETDDEVAGALVDLASIGVDIVTIGQYLRPTSHHLPVVRWVEPATFERYREVGEAAGIGHVEASPLTRSSYHARQAAEHVNPLALSVPVSLS
jgi:lipoic acid synthetase